MGEVIPIRRPRQRKERITPSGVRRVTGFAIALEARPGAVFLIADDIELGLSPEQARALAEDLGELADDAEARKE